MRKKKLYELIQEMVLYMNHMEECKALSIGHELRDNVLHKVYKVNGKCDCKYNEFMKKLKNIK